MDTRNYSTQCELLAKGLFIAIFGNSILKSWLPTSKCVEMIIVHEGINNLK